MSESGWLGHGAAIGREEFRRTVRSLRGDRARLAFLGIGGAVLGLGVVFFTWLIYTNAGDVAGLELSATVRGIVALQWLFGVFIAAQRAGSRYDRIDNESLMLLTVSVRAIVVGLLTAELYRVLSYLVVPAVFLGGAFVLATGSVVTAPLLVLSAVLFVVSALVVGYPLGLLAKLLVARVRLFARYKSLFAGLVVVTFVGGYVFVQNVAGSSAYALLGWLPFSWLVDLALLGSPIDVSPTLAGAAVVSALVWTVGWFLVFDRVATELWFGDSVEPAVARKAAEVDTGTARDPLGAATKPLVLPAVSQPVLRVAQRAVIVARRNPRRLSFLVFPLVGFGPLLINSAQDGTLFTVLPPLVALVLPWLAGAAFGLNPFGDEGPVLPATLTALPSGRQFALGIALPGLVFGLPLTVLATAATGVVGPYSLLQVGTLVVLGGVLTVCAVALAPALGAAFPRFDPIRVGSEREVVPPSLSAVILYSLALLLPGGFAAGAALAPAFTRATVSLLVGGLLAFPFAWLAGQGLGPAASVARALGAVGDAIAAIPVESVQWGGYVLALAVVVLLSLRGFGTVQRRFEAYSIE